ncbi:AbrB/MazE/SpoVT family DNA-binding domain-containing protein [Bacillus cereus]|uniref:Transcriptional regulator AbrB family n=1 Tax=Bacillus cereus TaxID=1396 RepID=A0A164LEZ9_BACCE|nr:AbrB/MazE/SpoVT family DNA-binding domain-containing protein [Bacillus cereus]KZD55745.1 transcriptional regulator AbrB family [Bacillus cereus]
MKATGIVRKVDELGRIVIPIEIRKIMGIGTKDPLEIYTEQDKVILKKYDATPRCMVTNESSENNISIASGKVVLSPEAAKALLEELKTDYDLQLTK